MKGITFNLVENVVCEAHGEQVWDQLLLGGAATYYGEQATVTHEQCTHRGDAVCVMRCRCSPVEAEAGPDGYRGFHAVRGRASPPAGRSERRARRDAEQIGEAATAELGRTVQHLEQAEAELRERAELTDLSYALSRSLRADLDPARMLERAVRALGESLGVDRVVVRLAEETTSVAW